MSYVLLLALIAGISVPVQVALNASLASHVGGVFPSATWVLFLAFIVMLGISVFAGVRVPDYQQLHAVPFTSWCGGLLGVLYTVLLIFCMPRIGVALTTSLVVFGQILMSMTIDHFALFGVAEHSFNWQRAVGIVLLGGGVTLIKIF